MTEFSATEAVGTKPSWVMWGVELPSGGVAVLASDRLVNGRISHREIDLRALSAEEWMAAQRYDLAATMKSFTIVAAATWQEAFARLFQMWNPAERQEITEQLRLEQPVAEMTED